MKANELRIGNWFYPCSTIGGITIPNTEIFWKVGAIDKFGKVSVIEFDQPENIYLPINECAKIPLDESWLIRAGAKSVNMGAMLLKFENFDIVFWSDGWVFILSKNHEHKIAKFKDMAVHSLQNLIHALTGTELQFAEE